MTPVPPGGGGKIDITPDDVNSAATTFAKQQNALGDAWLALASSLHAGMAGNDGGAEKFASRYDPAATSVWKAFEAACRVVGGISRGLVQTADNYAKAEHASTATGKSARPAYPAPLVAEDIYVTGPDPAGGSGHSGVPDWLAKYWPNGDPDALRDAARVWGKARDDVDGITQTLHNAVNSITANNDTRCLQAMSEFWDSLAKSGNKKAILSALHDACDSISKACDSYAQAIDDARHRLEWAFVGAGIAVTVTSVVGVLLTPITGGASDVGAGAADAAEVAAIAGPIVEEFEATVAAEVGESIATDVAADLEATAGAVPDIETAEADAVNVDSTVEQELEQTEQETAGQAQPARPESAPDVKIDDAQFGTKVGKHASDYGLDPANPANRAWLRGHIEEIGRNPEEVRQGPWNPDGGGNPDDFFYRRGDDVVVTKPDGTFVTILKGGIGNGWFKGASAVK